MMLMTIEVFRSYDPRVLEEEQEADRRAGEVLMTLRLANRLSVLQAATRAGIDDDEWTEHESGRLPVPISRVPNLARALGIEAFDLASLMMTGAGTFRTS